MDFGQMFGGALSIGVVGTFLYSSWGTIKSNISRFFNFFFGTIYLNPDQIATASRFHSDFLVNEYTPPKYDPLSLWVRDYYDSEKKKNSLEIIRNWPAKGFFLPIHSKNPFKIIYLDLDNEQSGKIKLIYFRWGFKKDYFIDVIRKFVKEYEEHREKTKESLESRLRVGYNFRIEIIKGSSKVIQDNDNVKEGGSPMKAGNSGGKDKFIEMTALNYIQLYKNKSKKHLSQYRPDDKKSKAYFVPDELKPLEKEIAAWILLEKLCYEKRIPWKRGYLLVGDPGNGKSSFIRYIGKKHGIPVFIFILTTMTANDFLKEWDSLPANCIVTFEDFDAVFNKRERSTKSMEYQDLTFDIILQSIDGISEDGNGKLLFITTNHEEKIDAALIKRAGRIDGTFRVGNPTLELKKEIANQILEPHFDLLEQVDFEEELSTANFREMCNKLLFDREYELALKKLENGGD